MVPPDQDLENREDEVLPLERRHPPMWWLLERYHLSLDALREMTDEFLPHVREREEQRLGPAAMAAMESLDQDQQRDLKEFLDTIVADARSGAPSNLDPKTIMANWTPTMRRVFKNDDHSLVAFLLRLRKATQGPDRTAIMHNSLLGQAIGTLDVLVSGVITRYFVAHPQALETREREFSLADLREFKDVEDASDMLLSRHVTKVMFGGLSDWADWFEKRCKLDLHQLALSWSRLEEVFQRRHVVMHNGGLVSRQYLAKVRIEGDPPEIGQRLPVDADYLHHALDELEVIGTLLCVMAWGKWDASDRDASAGALLQRSYDLMLAGRWAAAEKLTTIGRGFACSAATKEPIKVNGWNCRLELHGHDAIRDEVSEWDVSVAVGRFRLAKLVLLGDIDAAARLVPRLLAANEISRGQLKEWPILRTLRESDAFDMSTMAPAVKPRLAIVDEQ